jgi:hypothetical protein
MRHETMVSHTYILTFSLTFLYCRRSIFFGDIGTTALLSFCAADASRFVGVSWVFHSQFLYKRANALGFRLAGVVVAVVEV